MSDTPRAELDPTTMPPGRRLAYLEALDRTLYEKQSRIVVRRAELAEEIRRRRCSLSSADRRDYDQAVREARRAERKQTARKARVVGGGQ